MPRSGQQRGTDCRAEPPPQTCCMVPPSPPAELLEVTNEIEGHPDNLAPAIYGGLTASLVEDGKPRTVRLPLSPTLRWVAAIPDFELSTHLARAVLPKKGCLYGCGL